VTTTVHNINKNTGLLEIYNTVCDMNRNKYQIDSIVNIISDWKFENNSVYDSEQTTAVSKKNSSVHSKTHYIPYNEIWWLLTKIYFILNKV